MATGYARYGCWNTIPSLACLPSWCSPRNPNLAPLPHCCSKRDDPAPQALNRARSLASVVGPVPIPVPFSVHRTKSNKTAPSLHVTRLANSHFFLINFDINFEQFRVSVSDAFRRWCDRHLSEVMCRSAHGDDSCICRIILMPISSRRHC